MKKLSVSTISIHKYVEMFAFRNRSECLQKLKPLCDEIVALYFKMAQTTTFPILIWACIDRQITKVASQSTKYSLSGVEFRIDVPRSWDEMERHFINLTATIQDPLDCDMLQRGRTEFSHELALLLQDSLKMAAGKVAPEILLPILLQTRAWIHGHTSCLFRFSSRGELITVTEQLPEAEEFYTSPALFMGPPLDGPPYCDPT